MTIKKVIKTNKKLLFTISFPIAMFVFGLILLPLINIFSPVTGLNETKTKSSYISPKATDIIDTSRTITVQFSTSNNNQMPWEFTSNISEIKLHPGETGKLDFTVYNTTKKTMIGQIIPSITPTEATNYLHKVECFCFTSQTLKPLEKKNMPLRIIVDKELPNHIIKLILTYTLFDVTKLGPQM